MGQYYFIFSALPELKLGCLPDIAFSEMIQLFRDNLSDLDFSKVYTLLKIIDITNVYYYLTNQPLDPRGKLSLSEIEEALLDISHFPKYLTSFLEKYIDTNIRILNFSEVYLGYFEIESANSSGFMRNYLKFEMNLRLHLAIHRAKRLGREHPIEISTLSNPYDDFPYEREFEDISFTLLQVESRPLEEYQITQQYRFNILQNMVETQVFSLDCLLAYMMQLLIVEDQAFLSEIRGQQTMQKLLEMSA